ncbi:MULTISPECIES: hypothetical protein [unclassified Streptomyces]|uniref:hypothetical protein n=1 Tax=unclassified Streptomyces TaxID=2593676 RepID=UPI0036EF3E74
MRPARPVTGAAACAVTITALGLLTVGPSAYAGDAGTLRVDSAAAPRADGESEGRNDEGRTDNPSGSGNNLFGLNNPSGLNIPSLLDSVGGLNAFSGLDSPSRDEGSTKRDNQSGRDDSSSGRDNSSGRDDQSGRESSSGRDNSSSGRDNSSGRDSQSGRDSSSGRDGQSVPDAPSGHVKTGVGGSVRSDTTQIAAGAGVLAATAVGGAWLLRRRASGTQGAG